MFVAIMFITLANYVCITSRSTITSSGNAKEEKVDYIRDLETHF